MATSFRLVCAVLVVALISSCVQCAEVDVGRKLSAGSGEGRELMYMKDGYEHKGMDGSRMKDGYGSGSMGGWKKGYGKGDNDKGYGKGSDDKGYGHGHGHGDDGHGKGYPGHPH
ncbi:hypothetical protein KP509_30G009700 [Ceratopteris richardii]|uniref:Uncharacterized protein n=1 Tax=Ceratopteris richardii TaxID=49495 RepID=A0A8T2QZY6_CERRI|nr:hypothetical protein KP509_30G009700 [Ceratopteris richardii]